ncbi:MAG: cytochrome C [Bacteroidetes bacterium]|nr:MAG: cytochrome C [Bacteroidota bacterium]
MQTKLVYTQRINKLIVLFLLLLIYNVSDSFAQKSPKDNFVICNACHSIGEGKKIGPDLKGVTERHDEAWLIKFIQSSQTMVNDGDPEAVKLFEEYNKIPMPDNAYSEDEVKALLNYIETFDPNAVVKVKVKADPNFLDNKKSFLPKNTKVLFYLSLVIILLSIFDLAVTKFLRKAILIHVTLILSAVFVIFMVIFQEATNLGRYQGYEPDQPIAFSHRVHSGENKIDCEYCHSGAMDSKRSGIPSANLCLNCHNVIKEGTNTGTAEIAKIHKAVEEGKAIKWVKVHNLPDHVYYNHAQHVNAGKLDCTECHGDVENMGRIQQVSELSMGWCLDCHREKYIDIDNKYFANQYKKYHDEIAKGMRKGVTVSEAGGENCAKCHY